MDMLVGVGLVELGVARFPVMSRMFTQRALFPLPGVGLVVAADLVVRLAEGLLRPRIVVDDSNFGFLHPDLPTLLGDAYQYDPERRLFVRREVGDGGSRGGGVVPCGAEHRGGADAGALSGWGGIVGDGLRLDLPERGGNLTPSQDPVVRPRSGPRV